MRNLNVLIKSCIFRNGAIKKGARNLYPSYKVVQATKTKCAARFTASLDGAETDLQDLFNTTAQKIFTHLVPPEKKLLINPVGHSLQMEYKAGFDGSSGQQVGTWLILRENFYINITNHYNFSKFPILLITN